MLSDTLLRFLTAILLLFCMQSYAERGNCVVIPSARPSETLRHAFQISMARPQAENDSGIAAVYSVRPSVRSSETLRHRVKMSKRIVKILSTPRLSNHSSFDDKNLP